MNPQEQELGTAISALEAAVEQLQTANTAVNSAIDSLQAQVATVQAQIQELINQGIDLSDEKARIDSITATLAALTTLTDTAIA